MRTITLISLVVSSLIIGAKPASACWVFGNTVCNAWLEAAALGTPGGDWDSAVINARRALDASSKLSDPLLRACAVDGSLAELARVEAGKSVADRSLEIQQAASEQAWNSYSWNPSLESRCP